MSDTDMLAAEIIAIGSELLAPDRTDTNSLWLTDQLNRIGIDVKLKTIVGDDDARLEELIKDAVKRSRVVITTGGLGPTEDDITRKVMARALGRRLALDEYVLEGVHKLKDPSALQSWIASLAVFTARGRIVTRPSGTMSCIR